MEEEEDYPASLDKVRDEATSTDLACIASCCGLAHPTPLLFAKNLQVGVPSGLYLPEPALSPVLRTNVLSSANLYLRSTVDTALLILSTVTRFALSESEDCRFQLFHFRAQFSNLIGWQMSWLGLTAGDDREILRGAHQDIAGRSRNQRHAAQEKQESKKAIQRFQALPQPPDDGGAD